VAQWFETGWFRAGIRIDIDNLREYLNTLHAAMESEKQAFEKRVEQQAKQMDQESRDAYYDFMSDEHWRLNEVIPNLLYNSVLMAAYSLLEHSLIGLAKKFKEKHKARLSLDDLKYKGIDLARHFLDKVIGIPFPSDADWNEIQHLRKIRNAIAHSDGAIDIQNNALRDYIHSTEGLSLDEFDHIQVNEVYCRHILDLFEDFIIRVVEVGEATVGEIN